MVIDHSVTAHERNVNYGYKNKPEFRDKIMYFSMAANNPINAQYLINTHAVQSRRLYNILSTLKWLLSGDKSMTRMGAN